MDHQEKRARFDELEAQAKADETDWVVFFEAVAAWEEYTAARNEYYDAQEPGFWARLRTKITKRG
jgi:hypothetical protein